MFNQAFPYNDLKSLISIKNVFVYTTWLIFQHKMVIIFYASTVSVFILFSICIAVNYVYLL
jgi:hypothetical protein